jgi:hypothetical protein
MTFETIDTDRQEMPDHGFWASAAFSGGEYGVVLMHRNDDVSQGLFIPESKLALVLQEMSQSRPVWANMVRSVMVRIPLLRARVEKGGPR